MLIAVSEIISSSKGGVYPAIKSLFEKLLKELKKIFGDDDDDDSSQAPPAAGASLLIEEKQTVRQRLPIQQTEPNSVVTALQGVGSGVVTVVQ